MRHERSEAYIARDEARLATTQADELEDDWWEIFHKVKSGRTTEKYSSSEKRFCGGGGAGEIEQASEQASKQARKHASKQASTQASKQARMQASKQASQQASKRASKHSSKHFWEGWGREEVSETCVVARYIEKEWEDRLIEARKVASGKWDVAEAMSEVRWPTIGTLPRFRQLILQDNNEK